MVDGSWALAVALGHVRNAVVAFVAAEGVRSGESLFLAAAALRVLDVVQVEPAARTEVDRAASLVRRANAVAVVHAVAGTTQPAVVRPATLIDSMRTSATDSSPPKSRRLDRRSLRPVLCTGVPYEPARGVGKDWVSEGGAAFQQLLESFGCRGRQALSAAPCQPFRLRDLCHARE